jgi:hypothetical protein
VPGGANTGSFTSVPFTTFSGGVWPFFGANKNGVFVNFDGNLTFGAGDASGLESEIAMVTGSPRIAPLWDEFNPFSSGGNGVRTTEQPTTFTCSWTALSEIGGSPACNNFSVQMYSNGVFTMFFAGTSMSDGLCGITNGGNAAPPLNLLQSANFSTLNTSLGGWLSVSSLGPGRFQQFELLNFGSALLEHNDLLTGMGGDPPRITFVPTGTGYTYFTGTR